MKPSESTNRKIVWRVKDAGIEITFQRSGRIWGGSIQGEGGRMTMAMTTLDQLITAYGLGRYTAC